MGLIPFPPWLAPPELLLATVSSAILGTTTLIVSIIFLFNLSYELNRYGYNGPEFCQETKRRMRWCVVGLVVGVTTLVFHIWALLAIVFVLGVTVAYFTTKAIIEAFTS